MMKKLMIAIGFLLLLMVRVDAQPADNGFLLSGQVIYQEIAKMDIQLEGVDAQLAEQIPRERKTEKVLYFTRNESLFENHRKEAPEDAMPMEEGGVMIRMHEPDNSTYVDLVNKKVIEQKEFMSRVFLIESDLIPDKWKMTGKQKTILDYACLEATTEKDGHEVRVWFTPRIEVAAGPGTFNSLPGLVLAVEMNEGDRKLEAITVELKPLDKDLLKKPAKGKKITREEYQAIVTEKLEEMGVEGDGTWHSDGGTENISTVVIRIEQ